jgi:transcriptional regulator with XRE-family HTH domain
MASQNPPAWETLCRNVRWLRESHGFSVEETARLLRLAPCTLRKLESGVHSARVTVLTLYLISDAFDVPPERLLSERLEDARLPCAHAKREEYKTQ